MRYFKYNEYDPHSILADDSGCYTVLYCEQKIKDMYWPYWYDRMCAKFGKDIVDNAYTFEHCLEDWICTNWAWEVDEYGNSKK